MVRWLALPLLCCTAPVIAQDAPQGATADPPPAQLAFATLTDRMSVPVSIAGGGPYRFVIDTGAQRTVISRELANTLRLAPGPQVRLTALTGTSSVGTVRVPSLSISAIGHSDVDAPALSGTDLGASGLLGIDTLQGHAVSIDFDKQVMTVKPSSRNTRGEGVHSGDIVVHAKSLFGQLIVTDIRCNGQRVRVILDTGSPVSLGNEALRRRFADKARATHPIELASVTGQTFLADYGTIGRVTIGDLTIQHLPVAFVDAAPFRQFGLEDTPAILLGMDALKLFRRVEIDFANRQVRLSLPRDVALARVPG